MAIFIMAMSINPNAKKMHPDLSHQVNESLELFSKNNVKPVEAGRLDRSISGQAKTGSL